LTKTTLQRGTKLSIIKKLTTQDSPAVKITSDIKNSEKNIKTSYSVENNIKSNFAKGIKALLLIKKK
jgi:hypothetical protein